MTVVYTSVKREKTGIEDCKVLSVLNETLLVLMNLEDSNWILCLMLHWILQTLKIILKRQQQDQIVDQCCQSLLEIYLKHQSNYPCLIQNDFIETVSALDLVKELKDFADFDFFKSWDPVASDWSKSSERTQFLECFDHFASPDTRTGERSHTDAFKKE